MPKIKKILGWMGTIAEEELIYETNWVQAIGDTIVRCDHDAKNKGWGVWTVQSSEGSTRWTGGAGLCPGVDPENWINDDFKEIVYCEADYS